MTETETGTSRNITFGNQQEAKRAVIRLEDFRQHKFILHSPTIYYLFLPL